ncbi:MAG: glycosyltransferase family 2 protein [Methylococcaceae bacterium]|nr:glycosyltransferase family 2 protein [Methylococcaceae bacterium]
MLCSIIIPLYNKADFVADAIQSILNQSHQHFEVIVIDDGSTDDSASRVSVIHDHRIKLIQQSNQGVSCTRNLGIERAQGDLVFFLDADDWYLPTYLETIVSMALRHPEIAFFATQFKNINGTNQSDMFWNPGNPPVVELIDDLFYHWRFNVIFCTNSVAIRRLNLIQFQPCFPPGEQIAEDHDLWFRLAEQYRLAYYPAPLVAYRKEISDSLCATHEMNTLTPAYSRLEQRAINRQLPDNLRDSALRLTTEAKITIARQALINGRRYDALMQLLNAWRGITNSKRWWVSMVMCSVLPKSIISRWENWRHQRTRDW